MGDQLSAAVSLYWKDESLYLTWTFLQEVDNSSWVMQYVFITILDWALAYLEHIAGR